MFLESQPRFSTRIVSRRPWRFAPLEDPGVYRAVVPAEGVLSYITEEYLVSVRATE